METLIAQERVLEIADRCDVCQAQAFVMVKLGQGILTFCGHHFVNHEEKLNKFAYEIVDEREFINAKSESSN